MRLSQLLRKDEHVKVRRAKWQPKNYMILQSDGLTSYWDSKSFKWIPARLSLKDIVAVDWEKI